ncbi:hypothetical protein C2S52_019891 [Perilla frutescens var. hirtella]|uniref:Uncharacterized protein n=1 Tax=Perilla frutescens var. hirtella TaxID=608512 RepID=A0AAD4J4D6_PERFH|nr:hypothetical protein C2S52_019891 [Perilla frutescens var. hirtella]KAH6805885.1 hypothetical protein C2S51_030716 [Perilla frutescens var. frutescens]KAH6826425.1 hypothetical protein C2S53_013519 [Perilla frutescens var. hirtella]
MEDQKHMPDGLVCKPRKKKASSQYPEMFQSPGDSMKRSNEIRTFSRQKGQKTPKRGVISEVSPSLQPERSIPDSVPDSSTSGNEYRALRRKYLLLEEESFGLGRELKEVEDDIKTLEEEKLSLLDELVVLEGLIDPSDIQSQGQRLQ